MHETARRLLAVGKAKGARTFVDVVRNIDESAQTATNWKTRGVSRAGIIKASIKYGVDVAWLACENNGKRPDFLDGFVDNLSDPVCDPLVAREDPPSYLDTTVIDPQTDQVIRLMRSTDASGRLMALGAVIAAIDQYNKKKKRTVELDENEKLSKNHSIIIYYNANFCVITIQMHRIRESYLCRTTLRTIGKEA